MLSSLSVSCRPESRLRHWCSSIYLRIPPLHMEFHSPLLHSRKTVSDAIPRLSRGLSHQTYSSACARFTPNKSGQRLPPTYYRGCWHVVSRDFLVDYRQIKASYYLYPSSPTTELYDPKTFFTHAALLHQTCVHCGRFPTAASRRSLGRVSVPMWPFSLSTRLCIIALVSRYLTN
ncbi:hypothetical protein IMAU40088_01864 [Lactobacillus helveticus]|nr:hypothetical protein [Lactobacillus helveticus]